MLLIEDEGLGVTTTNGIAHVMQTESIWDTMTSDHIDEEEAERVQKVLEFMEGDY